jgi:hypothetical protein
MYPTGRQSAASSERANWPLLFVVGALSVALALLFARFAAHDTPALDQGSSEPKTLASPNHHNSHQQGQGSAGHSPLPNARTASGPHWSMQVPHSWTRFNAPNVTEDAAWRTPSSGAGLGGLVIVLHKKPDVPSDLTNYTYGAAAALNAGVGSGSIRVLRTHVYANHGEIEYLQNTEGHRLRNLAYVVETSNGFAYLTYAAPTKAYKHDVKRIEPYLKTLTGGR